MSLPESLAAREAFMSMTTEEKQKFLLRRITEITNGEISACPCNTLPQPSQEHLAEIFKQSKNIDGTIEIDFESAKINSYDQKADGTKREKKYRATGTNLFMISDRLAYSAVFGDEYLPMKLRVGKDDGKDILVARIQHEKGRYVYPAPDVCVAMSLIGRQKGIRDAVYMIVYDRIHSAYNKCTMIAIPDCGAPFNMIEFIKVLTGALAAKEGGASE